MLSQELKKGSKAKRKGLKREYCTSTSQGYRAEVRRNYEEFERAFAADMEWRDKWAAARNQEHKKERRKANKKQHREGRGDGARVAPGGDQAGDITDDIDPGNTTMTETVLDEEEGRGLAIMGLSYTTTGNDATKEDDNKTAKEVGVASSLLQRSAGINARSAEVDVLFDTATVETVPSPDSSPHVFAPAENAQIPENSEPEHDGGGNPESQAPKATSRSDDSGRVVPRAPPEDMPRAIVGSITRSPSFGGDLEAGEGGG